MRILLIQVVMHLPSLSKTILHIFFREKDHQGGEFSTATEGKTSKAETEIPPSPTFESFSKTFSGTIPSNSPTIQTPPAIATSFVPTPVAPLPEFDTTTTGAGTDPVSPTDTLEEQVSANTVSVNLLLSKVIELTGQYDALKTSVGSLKVNLSNSVSILASSVDIFGKNQQIMGTNPNELISAQNLYVSAFEESNMKQLQQLS